MKSKSLCQLEVMVIHVLDKIGKYKQKIIFFEIQRLNHCADIFIM